MTDESNFKVTPGRFPFPGNRDAAITVIREAESHIPNEPSVHFNLANMLGQKDEFVVCGSLQNYTRIRQFKDAGEGDFRSGSVFPVEASTGISRIKETAHGYNGRRK